MTLHEAIVKINDEISKNTLMLNNLDAAIGDGDFGSNVTKGFNLLIEHENEWRYLPLKEALLYCGRIFSLKIGGSSGQLFAIALMRMGETLGDGEHITNVKLADALENAKNGIQKLGGAQPGEKTLIDAIIPAYSALRTSDKDAIDFEAAYKGALMGAENTKNMMPSRGRASYLAERALGHVDAGSMAIVLIFKSLIM